MKTFLLIAVVLLLIGLAYFYYLGIRSQSGSAKGLVDGRLAPCPDTPNCICTEYPESTSHYTDPVSIHGFELQDINNLVQQSITDTGGQVVLNKENYISATYTSFLFRYVDDFEIHMDNKNHLLHIRSASRVGRSDFGANQKRITQFKLAFSRISQSKH